MRRWSLVKYFDRDDAKNAKLRKERGIGLEDVVFHIERGDLVEILEHPNREGSVTQAFARLRRRHCWPRPRA